MSLAIKRARFASQGGLSGNVQSGGIFDFLKSVGKKALKATRFLPGPIGAVSGAVQTIASRRGPSGPSLVPLTFQQSVPPPPTQSERARQAIVPGGRSGFEGLTLACPSGHHPNKSSYFTQAGFVEKGSRCVKNRRRNPMNPRALDRAISRVDSGKKLQHKLASITTAQFTAGGQRKHPHG